MAIISCPALKTEIFGRMAVASNTETIGWYVIVYKLFINKKLKQIF
jgi:hypothetical protein